MNLQSQQTILGNVNQSSTITTSSNNPWLSPSGEFAFGFQQLTNTTNLFMLAIWYNKIPETTIVWSAKDTKNNNLIQAPTGSQIQLTSGGLTLTTSEGESIWTAQPNETVSYGNLLDTGNFVLVNNSSIIVWESFKFPTDTLLPNQSLELNGTLTSRFSETNYTNGRFQLYFNDDDNNLMLSPLAWPTQYRYKSYYTIDVANLASLRLVFDESGDIYVETNKNGTRVTPEGTQWKSLGLDPKSYYYRATLDYYGVFTQFSHPRDSKAKQGWTIMSAQTCWKKRSPLVNGRDESGGSLVLIKTRVSPFGKIGTSPSTDSKDSEVNPLLRGLLIGSSVLNSILLAAIVLVTLLKPKRVVQGEEEKSILTDWACDCYMEGRVDVLVENDQEASDDIDRLEKWIKIAIWCIQEHPEMRPTMRMVMQMLEE
ncbi:hypothetical protein P8452_37774 [Trifolium repens]|nr:hypothetical protein P8452_37774 [Trifolium repens]